MDKNTEFASYALTVGNYDQDEKSGSSDNEALSHDGNKKKDQKQRKSVDVKKKKKLLSNSEVSIGSRLQLFSRKGKSKNTFVNNTKDHDKTLMKVRF